MQFIKNQSIVVTVDDLGGNGSGVAHPEGFAVFVPASAVGDVLRVKLIKVTKSYAVGKIEELLSPSPDRCESDCPQSARCGGCAFRHITYEAECTFKRKTIDDCFAHIARMPLRTEAFYGAPDPAGYRNKAIYPIAEKSDGHLAAGFYAAMSHRVIEHDVCAISPALFTSLRDACLAFFEKHALKAYNEETGRGLLRGLYMRCSQGAETVVLTLILCGKTLGKELDQAFAEEITSRFPCVTSILINTNTAPGNAVLGGEWRTLCGDGYLYDTLCGRRFRIAPASFYQVNRAQAEKLYTLAGEYAAIRPGETVFDLYCGTGTIGLSLAVPGVHLVGVEITPEAVVDAAYNAKQNGINAEFLCLDADEALDSPRLRALSPDVILIDPPRKGCGASAAEKIASFGASRIVYISCNPSTLARDLVTFAENGYEAQKAVGVDLFPRTGHVETVVLMSRT